MTTSPSARSFVDSLLALNDDEQRRALILEFASSDNDIAEAIRLLLAETERLTGIHPVRMERVSLDALRLAEQAGEAYLGAMARLKLADALRFQYRYEEASVEFDGAEQSFGAQGFPVEAARTRIGGAWVTASLGRVEGAMEAARKARSVLVAHGETQRVASLDMSTGLIYLENGRYREALRAFTRALRLHLSLGDASRIGAARGHFNRALALMQLGRHKEAMSEFTAARDEYTAAIRNAGAEQENQQLAILARSLGELDMIFGRHAAALRHFSASRKAFAGLDVGGGQVEVGFLMSECYLQLGQPDSALTVLDDVSEQVAKSGNQQWDLGLGTHRVAGLLAQGRYAEALHALDAQEDRHTAGALQHRAWMATQRASINLRVGSHLEALLGARLAQHLSRGSGARRLLVEAHVVEGSALLALGSLDEAAAKAKAAVRLALALDAAPVLYRAFELRGQVADARGQTGLARHYYEGAIAQLEREQREVIFEFRDNFARGRGLAYRRLVRLALGAGRPEEAIAFVERAKSRALVDAITGNLTLLPRANSNHRVARELATSREEYAIAAKAAADAGGARTDTLSAIESRITALRQQLQIEASVGLDDDLSGGPRTPFEGSTLAHGTGLIEYFVDGDDVIRFLITRSGIQAEVLENAMPAIERGIRSLRLNLAAFESANFDRRLALTTQAERLMSTLYGQLIGGMDIASLRGLVIVPHGPLHYLPFHALRDGGRYLVERIPVSYAPSATIYDICRRRSPLRGRRGRQTLVISHSAGGRLPFAVKEGATIAAQLDAVLCCETEATRSVLEEQGRRAPLIHIAAHGRFRADAPLFSAIELADGLLTTADVFNLELPGSLVVLSACETGNSVLGGGDELVGMARAFLYAGARALVVSQWRVEDGCTAELMKSFHEGLACGSSAAASLRDAQMKHLASAEPQTDGAHPFYWAAFQVIGSDQGLDSRRGISRSKRI